MIERLMMIEKRYLELNEELMNPEIISNVKETLKRTKEQAMLKDAYDAYQKYKEIESGISDAKEMIHDPYNRYQLELIKYYTINVYKVNIYKYGMYQSTYYRYDSSYSLDSRWIKVS